MITPQPYRDPRPWGEEVWLTKDTGTPSMAKIIRVKPGEPLSLQYHERRDEFWYVISGDGEATIGSERIPLVSGATCFVPRGEKHRVTGGTAELVFVELAFGEFDEDDIVRLEDKYGRT